MGWTRVLTGVVAAGSPYYLRRGHGGEQLGTNDEKHGVETRLLSLKRAKARETRYR
jgi:hypothetical protein